MVEIVDLILNQGVAIAMLIYFIMRFEKILTNNTKAFEQLNINVLTLLKRFK